MTELRKVTGDAKIMLGFDRGGAYPQVFTHCRDAGVDWITYRRAPLAPIAAQPRQHWLARAQSPGECVTLADEIVTLEGYGQARQLTLWRASRIPDTGPNKVRTGTGGIKCQNGAGSTHPSLKTKRQGWW